MKRNIEELNRIKDILEEAEKDNKLIINLHCGDQHMPNPSDPYPVFFTPDELYAEVSSGKWHGVRWGLRSRDEVKTAIYKRIKVLQERLLKA